VQGDLLWLTPLLFLPGVALLILSTPVRYGQIHGEIHHLLESGKDEYTKELTSQLFRRSRLFRNALITFYVCVGLLAVASILGGLLNAVGMWADILVMIMTCLGVLFMLLATIFLIRESILSLDIIKKHFDRILK